MDSGFAERAQATIFVRLVYGQDRRYERKLKARADVTGEADLARLDNLWGRWFTEARLRGAAVEMIRA